MADASWLFLMGALLASLAGAAWLALAMDAHWRQVMGNATPKPGTRRRLRAGGAIALLAAVGLCFMADRPSMAILVWVMLLSGNVLIIAMTLAWKPALLRIAGAPFAISAR